MNLKTFAMKKGILFLVLLITVLNLYSQVEVKDCDETKDLKTSTLYVLMNTKEDANQEYEEVFKKYWTLCPYVIIEPNQLVDYLSGKNYYMSPTPNEDLRIWTPNPKSVDKIRKKELNDKNIIITEDDIKTIAYIDILDTIFPFVNKKKLNEDFMGRKYSVYGGPGFLKNNLQYIQSCISTGKINKVIRTYSNASELKNLKKSTLYIVNYLFELDKKTGVRDVSNLKENYPFNYKIVTTEELSRLIINSEEPIYYMTHVFDAGNGMAFKYVVNIINSESGEIIYTDYVAASSKYLRSKMVERIVKEINISSLIKN